jgi:hypothetical protein
MRNRSVLRLVGAVGALAALTAVGERSASACGGCFHDPNEDDSVITDHRMILSVSPQQTTLYDQIEFQGAAASFAWVLPIKGTVTVGLSSDLMFASLDQLTETQVVPPPTNCPPPPSCEGFGFGFGNSGPTAEAAGASADAGAAVTVTAQQQVGPYETVQLHSSDPNALQNWLTSHGYAIPAAVAPVVAAYVADQFDFLAMKLVPGQGVTAMRPVRVTSTGANPTLPLRMVAVGTGATTGITLWVIGDSRWQPQNFPSFTISDSDLAWNWTTGGSNYETVRLSKEAAFAGKGWEIESSLEIAQYSLESAVEQGQEFGGQGPAGDSTTGYVGIGDGGAYGDADQGQINFDAGDAAISVPDGGYESATEVEQADFDTIFAGIAGPNARITRMRSDIAHTALTVDLSLEAATDQSELTNIHNPTQQIGQPLCPTYDDNCNVTGEVPRDQAIAASGGQALGGGVGEGGAGCSTTVTHSRLGSRLALGTILGFLGFGAIRARRRQRRRG